MMTRELRVVFIRTKSGQYRTSFTFKFGEGSFLEPDQYEGLKRAVYRIINRHEVDRRRRGYYYVEVFGSGHTSHVVRRSALNDIRRLVKDPEGSIEMELALIRFPRVYWSITPKLLDRLADRLARRYWIVHRVLYWLTRPMSLDELLDVIGAEVRPASREALATELGRVMEALEAYGVVERVRTDFETSTYQPTPRGLRIVGRIFVR